MSKKYILPALCGVLLLGGCSIRQQALPTVSDLFSSTETELFSLEDLFRQENETEAASGSSSGSDASSGSEASSGPDTSSGSSSAGDDSLPGSSEVPAYTGSEEDFEVTASQAGEYLYYYEHLEEEDRQTYREIYTILSERTEEGTLSTVDTDRLKEIVTLVLLDNPRFFYVDRCRYETSQLAGKILKIRLSPVLSMTEEEITQVQGRLDTFRSQALQALSGCDSQWDRAWNAYEYLCENLEYDETAPHNQDLYSVVLGRTVCQGYAFGYKYLCDQLGIPCAVVTGLASDGVAHAWNLVQLDGIWCYVDPTYGDMECLDEPVNPGWFGFGSDLMAGRSVDWSAYLPDTTDLSAGWYAHQHCSFDTYSEADIASLVQQYSSFSFHYTNEEAYEQAKTSLFTDKGLQSLIGNRSYQLSYITADECRCIFIRIEYR